MFYRKSKPMYKQLPSSKSLFTQISSTNTFFPQLESAKTSGSSGGGGGGSINNSGGNSNGGSSGSSGSSGISSLILNAFTNGGIKLLDLYAKNLIKEYYNEVDTGFKKIKNTYPQYKQNDSTNLISSFVDTVYELLVLNGNLDDEIIFLKKKLDFINTITSEKIKIKENILVAQSSSIKIIYTQYLLLYDLDLSGGKFIDAYLKEAERIYIKNGNKLYHPTPKEKKLNKMKLQKY
jgi:hypothetical protein